MQKHTHVCLRDVINCDSLFCQDECRNSDLQLFSFVLGINERAGLFIVLRILSDGAVFKSLFSNLIQRLSPSLGMYQM